MNFRDEVLFAARECLWLLVIPSSTPDPANPGQYYPERPTGPSSLIRTPNSGYFTPLWELKLRPIRSEDVGQTELIPSAFLRVMSGERSGRGSGLKNSPVRGITSDITEDYVIGIQCAFRDGVGARQEDPPDDSKAKSISQQVNGFIHDLDSCLNVKTLRPQITNGTVVDAYIGDWHVLQALEGSSDEILFATLVVTINYSRYR